MTEQEKAPAAANGEGSVDRVEAKGSTGQIIPGDGPGGHLGGLAAALSYARRGLAVFPLRPGAKVPYGGSRGHLDATTDADRLTETWPAANANVGVATGAASGIWVLDVDPRHGGDVALARLEADNDTLPATAEAVTPSGGRHLYWRWPADVAVRSSAGRVGPGLDVRGDGGYVVAPPSRLEEGCAYRWRPSSARAIADAPAWLLARVVERPAEKRFAEPVVGVIGDGERNVKLTSIAGKMRGFGCEAGEIRALLREANRNRCRPPLTDREVDAIVESVMRYEPNEAWWAVAEAVDEAATEWADAMDEAFARWAGGR